MDDHHFDTLTRALTSGASRRTVLRRLAGGLLGGAAVARGLQPTGAQPQPKVGICHRDGEGRYRYQEVNGNAVATHEAHGDVIAPDFSSDASHCGGCGITCGDGETCDDGECVATGFVVSGEITDSSPTFDGGCRDGRHYDAYTFEHTGGDLSLSVRGEPSGSGSLPDPGVALYAGGVPTDYCPALAENDDSICNRDSYLLLIDQPAGTYTAVVIDYQGRLGSYIFERNAFNNHCP
jgi:hypothetical protein